MGAEPKQKVSRHRRGNRRRHQVLAMPTMVICPSCKELMKAHHVCKSCGKYRARQVIRVRESDKE